MSESAITPFVQVGRFYNPAEALANRMRLGADCPRLIDNCSFIGTASRIDEARPSILSRLFGWLLPRRPAPEPAPAGLSVTEADELARNAWQWLKHPAGDRIRDLPDFSTAAWSLGVPVFTADDRLRIVSLFNLFHAGNITRAEFDVAGLEMVRQIVDREAHHLTPLPF